MNNLDASRAKWKRLKWIYMMRPWPESQDGNSSMEIPLKGESESHNASPSVFSCHFCYCKYGNKA